ncbi:MAG: hypothetical protein QG602_3699, partial [Verrucomicrobiota bacterium]|nr:hypothetical protein [Verrucomicrobiota bacterium]
RRKPAHRISDFVSRQELAKIEQALRRVSRHYLPEGWHTYKNALDVT